MSYWARLKGLVRNKRSPARKVQAACYIHIPKTAGTYLAQLETDGQPVLSGVRYLGHTYVTHKPDVPNPLYYPRDEKGSAQTTPLERVHRCRTFATARNIYDWLVSYASHAGGWNPRYRDPEHYDYENTKRGFDYLVRTIAERETLWPNRRFIFCQLFCSDGELAVDWLCRTETLDADLLGLARAWGLTYSPREHQRLGNRKDYRTYYSDSLVELVSRTWERELALFGYRFEKCTPTKAPLGGRVDPWLKRAVRYHLHEDELRISGRACRKAEDIRAACRQR